MYSSNAGTKFTTYPVAANPDNDVVYTEAKIDP